MGSIIGQTEVITKEISSKVFVMDMVSGKTKNRYIRVTIEWIKSKV